MNIRDLKYVIAVAETSHFGRAAERCFVSQPTLSGQVRKLEEELGVTIFERTNRSVKITSVGETILAHAHKMIEQEGAIQQLAMAQQDQLTGPLRVGAIPTLSPYLMPLILRPLKEKHPQMKLILSEEFTDRLLSRLYSHEIDAALLATPVEDTDFEVMPLFKEPFWLAYPRDHPFYYQDEISRKNLYETELLLLSEGHCLAEQTMDLCHLNDRKEQGDMADLRALSLETLLQLVGAGFGSTLVPALAMGGSWTSGSGIATHKLNFKDAYRNVSLVYRKSYPRIKALDALSSVILENLPNSVTPARVVEANKTKNSKTPRKKN